MSFTDMQRCIQECERCHDTCVQVIGYCLHRGGRHADPNHIATLLDCADMCATSANLLVRDSPRHRRTCEICAEVCDGCAKELRIVQGRRRDAQVRGGVPPLRGSVSRGGPYDWRHVSVRLGRARGQYGAASPFAACCQLSPHLVGGTHATSRCGRSDSRGMRSAALSRRRELCT
jgi:hypothetical protein